MSMDADERARLGAEILEEISSLLQDRLAADAWGRLLVTLAPGGEAGSHRVASIDVDDIVGEESALERAFEPRPELAELLSALAAATEALSALAGVDLEQTQGGTFLRRPEGGFAWLPGLVRAPSAAFEGRRDRDKGELERRWRDLPEALRAARVELDAEARRVTFFGPDGRRAGGAKALLVGSFSLRSRAWLWGWAHRDLPEPMRREVKDVLDAVLDRSLWEVSERQFGTDEATAWALCGLFCAESSATAALRLAHAEGGVYVAVYDVQTEGDLSP